MRMTEGTAAKPKRNRPDRDGTHRAAYERNRKKVMLTQDVCGICGRPVDKSLKWPHPLAPTVDHIIPIDKGGHPSAIENLQLAHAACNRQKSDKLQGQQDAIAQRQSISASNAPPPPRLLPLSLDWLAYRG